MQPSLVSITPAFGPSSGGTTVTITITAGSYLCAFDPCTGPVLLIGGISVPYAMPDSTTLVAVTPPHPPGPVDVELRPGIGSIGTPSSLQNAFTYLAEAIPSLSVAAIVLLAFVLAVSGLMRTR